VISVVVLQNSMDLVRGKPGSCDDTCPTSLLQGNEIIGIEAKRISGVSIVVNQETTIAIINTEPNVCCVPLVSFTHICYRLYL